MLQQVRDAGAGAFVDCEGLQQVALEATQIMRECNPHAARLYLSASVGRTFRESAAGQEDLRRADAASLALWKAAEAKHSTTEPATVYSMGGP